MTTVLYFYLVDFYKMGWRRYVCIPECLMFWAELRFLLHDRQTLTLVICLSRISRPKAALLCASVACRTIKSSVAE
jgi:hypothetical protein